MYIVPIAWLYVAFMMAVAEATNSTGSLLGAAVTFVLYGVAPVLLVVYLMGTPARKRAIKARELTETMQQQLAQAPDPQLAQTSAPATAAGATTSASSGHLFEPNAGGQAATAAQTGAVPSVRKVA